MECTFTDWKDNIDLVNAGFTLMYIHGSPGYSGKEFTHCPWCGTELIETRTGVKA